MYQRLNRATAPLALTVLVTATGCGEAGPMMPDVPADAPAQHVRLDSHLGDAVPYRGEVRTISSVPGPPPTGCELYLETSQEGEASSLGRFTGTGTTCGFNLQAPVFDPPANPAGGPPPYFVSEFEIEQTHVTANGDLLYVSGTGVFVQSLVDGSSGIVGLGSIEGGTGRFVGATGSFHIEGVSGLPNHFDGWISYDASYSASLP